MSDTAVKDSSADKSGPKIIELLQQANLSCVSHEIVSDEIPLIQKAINLWAYSGEIDLVFTTGGTGFGVRDKTPEVYRCLARMRIYTEILLFIGCRSASSASSIWNSSLVTRFLSETYSFGLPVASSRGHSRKHAYYYSPWKCKSCEREPAGSTA